jgi:hypothetical protein
MSNIKPRRWNQTWYLPFGLMDGRMVYCQCIILRPLVPYRNVLFVIQVRYEMLCHICILEAKSCVACICSFV